ncbi:hypothetical protein COMA1_40174 [Candidatus Nitrospira nitrosa]|uniref:Uncharacterized protein n=1 Tax=Candidatus Nitrospira nitrosa TaxID=1742972 RepID=A0A0S4LL21_9BACT|nr:hypothetical protein COMA1_40174 [Candidatus Nitrospira nitrosa]
MFPNDRDFSRGGDRKHVADEGMLHPTVIDFDIKSEAKQDRIKRQPGHRPFSPSALERLANVASGLRGEIVPLENTKGAPLRSCTRASECAIN